MGGCFIRNNVASNKTTAEINVLLAHYQLDSEACMGPLP